MMSANKAIYVQGETATFTEADGGYIDVTLRYGAATAVMTLADGAWTATVATGSLSGRVNYAVMADGVAVAVGSFIVRPLVSKYAAVVEAIDAAMQKNAVNGKYSVSVGEINLSDKTFDEMVKWRAHFADLAARDVNGEDTAGSGSPQFTLGVYHGLV